MCIAAVCMEKQYDKMVFFFQLFVSRDISMLTRYFHTLVFVIFGGSPTDTLLDDILNMSLLFFTTLTIQQFQ